MSNSVTIAKETPKREYWVQQFNLYRASNTLKEAAQLIWADWNNSDNVFFDLLPNPEALIFSLLIYVPDRAAVPVINAGSNHIKWNDAPVYDSIYNDYHNIPVWNCADWQAWHEALETHYQSTTTANGIWKSAWLHEDNECMALGVLCPDTAWCRYDCDFVKYFASKDMTVGNLFSNVYCDLSAVVLNLTEAAENASEGVNNTSKTIAAALPWVAGLGIAYGVRTIYNEF